MILSFLSFKQKKTNKDLLINSKYISFKTNKKRKVKLSLFIIKPCRLYLYQ